MKGRKKGRSFVSLFLAFALVLTLIPVSYFGFSARADEVTPPAHSKTLTDNKDGTYNLNLSVTGSSTTSETKNKANVVIVMDVSGSMKDREGNTTRLAVAKRATKSLINSLAANNTDANDDTVEISFMTFSSYANTGASYYGRWYSGTDMSYLTNRVDNTSADGGTNWDDALHDMTTVAQNKKAAEPDEALYYIFVTDGNPTYYMNSNHTQRQGTGYEQTNNINNSLTPALREAETIKNNGFKFYGVGAFGNVDRMNTLCTSAGGEYYSASNEEALNNAFAQIISSITNAENFRNVKITDGITDATSSTVLMDGATASDYVYKITDPSNNKYEIKLNGDGTIASINGKTTDVTLTDSVGASLELKIGAAFPAAGKTNNNSVAWDLSSLGQLLNGYTYTVSFRVWPSQEAYDTLADLENGVITLDDANAKQNQYVQNKDGSYSLRTNTKAEVSFDSIKTKNGEVISTDKGTAGFDDVPTMPLTSTKLSAQKTWVGGEPEDDNASVTLELYKDGEPCEKPVKVTLNKAGNWTGEVSIAPGLVVGDETLDAGHDYELREVETNGFEGYRYEYEAKTVHPMLIDSATEMKDALNNDSPMSTITATNIRKSTLSIDKSVTDLSTDKSADKDQLFTYEIAVTDANGDDVWFSIGDGTQPTIVDGRVKGAEAEEKDGELTGYYSAKSGSTVTVDIKAGENIYFINLPVGSTYEVKEINIPKGYTNTSITNSGAEATNTVPEATGKIAEGNTNYQVSYTNTYDAVTISSDTNNALQVTKKVEGLDAIEQFAFELTPGEAAQAAIQSGDIVVAENANQAETTTEGNIKKDGTETVSFGKYTFFAEGEYAFTAKETTTTTAGGWTYDDSEKTITVTIAKDESGKLTAAVKDNNPVFTNSYKAAPTTAEIPVEKILSVSQGLNAPDITEDYTFTLEAVNGAPMPEEGGETVKNPNADGGEAKFGAITFTEPGTYIYRITESGQVEGVANDTAVKEVTVVVTDNKDGTMSAVVNGDVTTTFTNRYEVDETTAQIPVRKVLVADDGLNVPNIAGQFTFTLEAVDGAPMPTQDGGSVVTNPAADGGTAYFGTIRFTEPGTYKYTITETGSVAGVTNDTNSTKEIEIVVTDKGDGTMTATVNGGADVTFTNEYKVNSTTATIPVTKALTKSDPSLTAPGITEAYTFTLSAEDGTPMPAEGGEQVTNPAADGGTANFGEITFTKPGTYTYTITEVGEVAGITNDTAAETGKIVTVIVTDDGKGNLNATVQGADTGSTDATTFTNNYSVQPVSENIPVTKILAKEDPSLQAPDITGKYTFTLTAVNGAPTTDASGAPITTSYTNPEADGGSVTFAPIAFTKPGTYVYNIAESGRVDGITNDSAASKTVVVIVTDNGDGTLKTEVKGADGNGRGTTFTNTYSVDDTTAVIPVTKSLTVPEGLTPGSIKDKFTFTIAAAEGSPEGTPLPAKTSVTNPEDQGGSADFGTITFTKPGTYTYTITESGSADGVTNDTKSTKTVTVTVVDNHNGTLTATVAGADGDGSSTTFTNSYAIEEPVDVVIPVGKEVSAEDGLTPPDITGEYTFTIAAAEGSPEGTPLPEAKTVTNPSRDGGVASFGSISYDKPGTYTYTITETGEVEGITNDSTSTKTVIVTVTDNGDGTLSAVSTSTQQDPVTFINIYETDPITAEIPVEKILAVPDGLTAPDITEAYTFTLTAVDDAPMPEAQTQVKNPEADGGEVSFGEITYDKPGTYTYTVTETGSVQGVANDSVGTKTVKVVVTDNSDGTLTATVNGGKNLTFTNSYSVGAISAAIPVNKILQVEDGLNAPDITGKFTFTLTDEDGNVIEEITNPAANGGSRDFAAITYTEPGTYTYIVTESGDVDGVTNDQSASRTVKVIITDNSDGTLSARVNDGKTVEFINTYTVEETTASIPVDKILSAAEELNAPDITEAYTFVLSVDRRSPEGTPLPEATTLKNPEADGGSMSFGEITYTKPGTYIYTVTESGTVAGITNDQNAQKTVTVVVTDNRDGTLSTEVRGADNDGEATSFTNTYSVDKIEVEIPVDKTLEVDDDLTAPDITNKFTFTLKDAEGEVLGTITNPDADGGNVSFAPITYTKPGTYTYTVTETGTVAGITNDAAAEREVTVVITDNGDGTLSAEIQNVDGDEIESIDYTNTYTVAPATASIPVKKILAVPAGLTAPDITDEFTFTLTADEGTPMPEVTELTNPDADGGNMSFGEITYTKPGTYTYTVTESGQVSGITSDVTAARTFDVIVKDNSDGTLTATVNGGKDIVYTNSYSVGEVNVTIPVTKALSVADGLNAPDITGKFTFTLRDADGKIVDIVTNPAANGGSTAFGAITFKQPGEYTYTVTETGTVAGITNDEETVKTVTIKVTDNSDGTLNAVVQGADEDGKSATTFTNTYSVKETSAVIPVTKILDVEDGLTAPDITDKFTFTLTDADGNEIDSITNPDADGGDASFAAIKYTKPGTYTYKVKESGTVAGVRNDSSAEQTITVVVTDNRNGTLSAVVNGGRAAVFTNTYEVDKTDVIIPVTKILDVEDGLAAPDITGKYTFTLRDSTGAVVDAITNPNADGGQASFKALSFDKPGTYMYTVTETGSVAGITNDALATRVVTIVVTDNSNGTLSAVVNNGQAIEYTNTYTVRSTVAQIPVEKILAVPAELTAPDITEAYTFTLSAADGTPMPADGVLEIKNPNATGGTARFGSITYDKPGTYTYTVTETGSVKGVSNDSVAAKTVDVVVRDNSDGTLTATVNGGENLKFTNSYSVGAISAAIPVSKILDVEDGLNAPDITGKFTFTLTDEDGNVVEEITNPAANGGSTSFTAIEYREPGTYTYTVTESGEVAGITNDRSASRTVKVVITDNSDGTLRAEVNGGKGVEFTNTYAVSDTTAVIPVKKTLTAAEGLNVPDITGKFTFTLTAADGTPMPDVTAITNPDADGGETGFAAITFTKPGTYTYTVTETGSVAGITNDQSAQKTVTVVVTDGSDGTLSAQVKGADGDGEGTTFTNTYKVNAIDVEIPVDKILDVDADLTAPDITGEFTFTLKDAEGEVLDTITNPEADGGEASFDAITYTRPGTYTYTVTESGTVAGITNDQTAERDVTVVITDNGNGTLSAKVNDGEAIEYTNTYSVASTTAQIPVEKILAVPEGLTAPDITGKFTFTLKDADGNEIEQITNPDADGGEANFAAISYDKPGTYTYTVTESGTVAGISNDSVSTRTVSVVVTDNSDGTLTAVVNGGEAVKFTNSYSVGEVKAAIPVTKILDAASGLTAPDITEAYTFTLTAADGTPMPAVTEITNPAADGGTRSFDAITYTEPGTYTYTVTESGKVDGIENDAEAAKTVQVVVTDNSDGTLTAVVNDGAAVEFTNTYKVSETVANIPVEKILSVPEGLTAGSIAGKFTFTLSAEEGTPMPEKTQITNPDANGGIAVFDTITYTEPGTYTYTVTESGSADGVTNDQAASKTVQVVVTDNSKGALNAVVNGGNNLTFTNSYEVEPVEVSLPVQKQLYVPAELTGPADISGKFTFTITGADEETPLPENMQIVNPAADGGMAEFGSIEYTRPGTYVYTVTESGNVSGITNDAQAAAGKTVTVQVTDNGDGTLSAVASTTADEPLTFTNIYSVEPTTARITAVKRLQNADLAQGAFNFELSAKTGGAPMPASNNAANDANGTVVFGEMTFRQPGVYEYTVKETVGRESYYEYSEDTFAVTITVTDNQDGTLSAVVSGDGRAATFTNIYLAESDEVVLSAEKRVNGEAATANIFEFTITADDGGALPAETRVTNNGGSVSFGPIKYTSDIFAEDEDSTDSATTADTAAEAEEDKSETAETAETADTAETSADQSTEDAAGEADSSKNAADEDTDTAGTDASNAAATGSTESSTSAEAGSTGAGETEETQDVENAESGSTDAQATENAAEGASAVDAGLTGRGTNAGYKFIRTANVTEGGEIQSPEIADGAAEEAADNAVEEAAPAQTAADAAVDAEEEPKERVRTFHYTITEVVGDAPGYTYDTSSQGVTVTVTDNGDGTLSTSVEYDSEDVSFNNLYHAEGEADIEVKKVLNVIDGNAQLKEGDFTFGLFSGDEQIAEATNDADGNVTFTVDYDETDGGQHVYTVRELVTNPLTGYTYDTAAVKTAIVDVQDDGKGHMDTNVMYPDKNMTFTNTYEPLPTDITIKGTKELKGRSLTDGEFAFTLTDESGKTVATGTNAADGSITFTNIPISRTGVYKYTATETAGSEPAMTYDSNKVTFTVNVVDEDGELAVESITPDKDGATFTNSYDPAPSVKIEKHATNVPFGKKYAEGDTIKYLITVTNDGNVPLTDVLVKDELTGNEWTLAILDIGKSKSYEASYIVTKADAEKGDVLNEATVTAKTPDPNTPTVTGKDDDTELVKKPPVVIGDPPTGGSSARTGDEANAVLWILLIAAAVAAGTGVVVVRKRGEKKQEEK